MNMGIFIMMVPPFVILAGFLLLCWRRNSTYRQRQEQLVPPLADRPKQRFQDTRLRGATRLRPYGVALSPTPVLSIANL